jgi:hypothetical protein
MYSNADVNVGNIPSAVMRGGPDRIDRRSLKALEAREVIASRLYERHPPRPEYYLTEKGKALGPVLKALHGWGEQSG